MDLVDELLQLFVGAERGVVATLDIVNAFMDCGAQPFELGLVSRLNGRH